MAKKKAGTITGAQSYAVVADGLLSKWPGLTKDQVDKYVNAAVAKIPGVGATGDLSVAPGPTS
jgi:hypothetical protein